MSVQVTLCYCTSSHSVVRFLDKPSQATVIPWLLSSLICAHPCCLVQTVTCLCAPVSLLLCTVLGCSTTKWLGLKDRKRSSRLQLPRCITGGHSFGHILCNGRCVWEGSPLCFCQLVIRWCRATAVAWVKLSCCSMSRSRYVQTCIATEKARP